MSIKNSLSLPEIRVDSFRVSGFGSGGRDWYLIAKQPAPAQHLAHPEGCAARRILLVTVPRVSRSCQHSPSGLDLHLLQSGGAERGHVHAAMRSSVQRVQGEERERERESERATTREREGERRPERERLRGRERERERERERDRARERTRGREGERVEGLRVWLRV